MSGCSVGENLKSLLRVDSCVGKKQQDKAIPEAQAQPMELLGVRKGEDEDA